MQVLHPAFKLQQPPANAIVSQEKRAVGNWGPIEGRWQSANTHAHSAAVGEINKIERPFSQLASCIPFFLSFFLSFFQSTEGRLRLWRRAFVHLANIHRGRERI